MGLVIVITAPVLAPGAGETTPVIKMIVESKIKLIGTNFKASSILSSSLTQNVLASVPCWKVNISA